MAFFQVFLAGRQISTQSPVLSSNVLLLVIHMYYKLMKTTDQNQNGVTRWQQLKKNNVAKDAQMAIDLVEGRKGELYRSTVKAYLSRRPSCFEQVILSLGEIDSTYPCRLIELLDDSE